jgi:hypothetical protein
MVSSRWTVPRSPDPPRGGGSPGVRVSCCRNALFGAAAALAQCGSDAKRDRPQSFRRDGRVRVLAPTTA